MDSHKYHEIIVLYAETKRVTMKEEKEAKRGKAKQIRKPAGDDWF